LVCILELEVDRLDTDAVFTPAHDLIYIGIVIDYSDMYRNGIDTARRAKSRDAGLGTASRGGANGSNQVSGMGNTSIRREARDSGAGIKTE
jgi:phosphate-selective porin